jgi:hypothetical protein
VRRRLDVLHGELGTAGDRFYARGVEQLGGAMAAAEDPLCEDAAVSRALAVSRGVSRQWNPSSRGLGLPR